MREAYVPAAVHATPEFGSIGIDEAGAMDHGYAFEVRRADFAPLSVMLSTNHRQLLVKMIVARATGIVLGLHVAGKNAAEITQSTAAMSAGGITENDLHCTIVLHPTNAEEIFGLGRARRPRDQVTAE